jgi:hypothetical protein
MALWYNDRRILCVVVAFAFEGIISTSVVFAEPLAPVASPIERLITCPTLFKEAASWAGVGTVDKEHPTDIDTIALGYGLPSLGERNFWPKDRAGFFLRTGLGGRYSLIGKGSGTSGAAEARSGPSVSLDIEIGGAVAPGIVLAFGVAFNSIKIVVDKSQVTSNNDSGATDESYGLSVILGITIDIFVDPAGDFHVGGLLGISDLSVTIVNKKNENDDTHETVGLGGGLHAGYELWVGRGWSIGIMARAVTSQFFAGGSVQSFGIALDALYF